MKPIFQNVTKYNAKNYQEFVNFHKNKYNFSYKTYTIIMSILLIYCIILNIKQKNLTLIALFVVILIVFLILRLYVPTRRYLNTQSKYKKHKEANFTFSFYKHYFTLGKNRYYYFKLFRVFETKDYFYLYINEDFAALVSKDGFNIGNAIEFSDFIKKKCFLKYSNQS